MSLIVNFITGMFSDYLIIVFVNSDFSNYWLSVLFTRDLNETEDYYRYLIVSFVIFGDYKTDDYNRDSSFS